MTKYIKIFVVFTVVCLCFTSFVACSKPKSDEELITARIDKFVKSYNSGDMDEVLECLDAKTQNAFKASMNIGNMLISKTGYSVDISDLFGLSSGSLTLTDRIINMESDTKATVYVTVRYEDKYSNTQEEAFFTMVKEDDDWFINNFESK